MKSLISGALALAALIPSQSDGAPLATDLSYTMPIVGTWGYSSTNGGSEASFRDSSGALQLTLRCTRSTRRIAILKSATAASPLAWIWTSSQSKNFAASYDAAAKSVSVELAAYDSFLDAIASSRGRFGFRTSDLETLVVPPWADVGRVIEDCRT